MLTHFKLKLILRLTIIALFLGTVILPLTTLVASAEAYKVEVSLPGMINNSVSEPGEYIRYLFIFGVSLAGFLAVGMIIYGGVQYMLASSVGSTQRAKEIIIGALSGVALILCSYLLLATIDPSLTNLSPSIPSLGNISAPTTIEQQKQAAAKDSGFNSTYNPSGETFFVCMSTNPYETDGSRSVYQGSDAESKCQNDCSKKGGSKTTYWCQKYPR